MAGDFRRRAMRLIAAPLFLAAVIPAAQAQMSAAGVHAGQIDVPLNKSQTVTLDRPFGRAMIGSEEIADIMPISDRSIYVLGKKMGTTSLTVYDRGGRVITIVDVAVGPDVLSLRRQLSELMPGEKIDARIANDSVVLSGVVSSAAAAQNAVQIAGTYAGEKVVNMMGVGSSQQVMLEVRFSEINRQTGKEIGVSGFFRNGSGRFDGAIGNGAQLIPDATGEGVLKLSSITDSFGIFRKNFSVGGLDILGVLDSLEDKGLAKTLAEPTLVALSGEKASFLAGGEFPIPVVQGGSGGGNGNGQGITIEFKPFGVSLGFTPTILADGVINMIVEPEVSSIDPNNSIVLNDITIPGLQTRRASTTLELRDGESFAIAGLICVVAALSGPRPLGGGAAMVMRITEDPLLHEPASCVTSCPIRLIIASAYKFCESPLHRSRRSSMGVVTTATVRPSSASPGCASRTALIASDCCAEFSRALSEVSAGTPPTATPAAGSEVAIN